jgi:hypothetical protein
MILKIEARVLFLTKTLVSIYHSYFGLYVYVHLVDARTVITSNAFFLKKIRKEGIVR